jgi:enamine deaminase RidA (YjgF/YER057c/UK114 family)
MPPDQPRRFFNLPDRRHDLPFSDGVLVGDMLHLSGRIGLDPANGRPPVDPDDEARLMLDGVRAVLARAGMTMADLVSVQIFCPDLSLFERFNTVYRSYFEPGALPARAFIGSGPLLYGGRFEMLGVAIKR